MVSGIFITEIFIEIIVDSHTVVKNNTEQCLVYLAQFFAMVTFLQNYNVSQPEY